MADVPEAVAVPDPTPHLDHRTQRHYDIELDRVEGGVHGPRALHVIVVG